MNSKNPRKIPKNVKTYIKAYKNYKNYVLLNKI